MKKIITSLFVVSLILIGIGCSKDNAVVQDYPVPELPESPYNYTQLGGSASSLIANSDNTPFDNQMTDWGATLGRVLFYDGALSVNNSVSCGSCHHQQIAFADTQKGSIGFEGKRTPRNTPPIMNMRFARNFFWDFSVGSLEQQVLMPVRNHIEMGMEDLDYLEEKLQSSEYYPDLFYKAFGSTEVTSDKVSKALSQFVRSIVSVDSKFDKAMEKHDDFSDFDNLERHGLNVFLASGCNNCHSAIPGFFSNGEIGDLPDDIFFPGNGGYGGTGEDLANIGLDMVYADQGAGLGRFKVPSLRNISFTAPYMHDGRFKTLEEVVEHYVSGVQAHPALDQRLRDFSANNGVRKLELSDLDKTSLIKFLQTFNDPTMLADPKFSNPFVN